MAGDTRDPSNSSNSSTSTPRGPPPGQNVPPPHITSGAPKVYEAFNAPPKPPPSANALPEGSGQNTAGAHQPAPKLGDVVKTVRLEDFKQVYMYPCVRESLLMGIGGGFGIGGVRALWRGMFSHFCSINWE
jgi:cytochrome c oxidase assembly protein subunit 20